MKFYIAAFCASFGVGILALGFLMPMADEHLSAIQSLLGWNGLSKTDESGPAVVVTVSSAKSLITDADYFSQSFGIDPSMLRMVKNGIDRALVGVDQNRPFGVACYFVPGRTDPYVLLAVPVNNFDRFVGSLEAFGSVSRSKLTFQPRGQEKLMIRKQNDYALLSTDEPVFKLAPENPFKLFEDAADTHRIACQVYGSRIPERSKDEFFEGFTRGIERSAQKSPALAKTDVPAMLKEFRDVIYNTDTLFWGIDFDRQRKNLVVDFEIEGNSESRYAKTAELNRNLSPTKFAGFARNASALGAVLHTHVPKENAESFKKSLQAPFEQFKTRLAEEFMVGETEKFVALADKALGVLQATIERGHVDLGATMEIGDDQMNLAIGASVPNPEEFEIAGKELFQLIRSADKSVRIRENAEEYQGIVFHKLVAKPSATNEKTLPFGQEIKLVIGIAETEVYLALGSDPIETLKKSIDDSKNVSGDIPMLVSNIGLSHWRHLMLSDDPQIRMFKKILAGINGKDNISLEIDSTGRGQRMRFQMDTAVFTSARQIAKQRLPDVGGKSKTVGSKSNQKGDSPFQRLQRLPNASANPSSGSREVGDAEADFLRRVYSH